MRVFAVAAAVSFFFNGAAMSGQQPVVPRTNGQTIHLNVVVTPGDNGKAVGGLAQTSFTVLDNGAPQAINTFRALDGVAEPVKVLLVVDAVNVPFVRVAYEREELDKFLQANDGQLAQPTALAIFTDSGTQIQQNFTKDGNAVKQELDKQTIGLRDLRRSSGFYGAEERLDMSLKTLSQLVTRAETEPGRKFIVWMTPGWPLISGPGIQLSSKQEKGIYNEVIAFSDALRRANTTLYTIDPTGAGEDPARAFYYEEFLKGLKDPRQAVPGDLGVQVLSVQSGGRFFTGNNDLRALLGQCFADASMQYELSYQAPPPETAPEYHHTEVRMADKHLVARTRTGYYAHP